MDSRVDRAAAFGCHCDGDHPPQLIAAATNSRASGSGQLTGSLPALDIAIDIETSGGRDALFPGPGGEAPDAYTWG